MYIGVVTTSYATSFFTPTILSELGWTAVHAQIFTIPIYAVAFLVTVIIALYADHIRHRFAFAMLGILVATTGYIILLAQEHIPVRAKYLAIYLVTSGGYITQPVIIVWLNNNMGGHFKRCFGSAMQIGFGNLGGIIASNIFITSDAPLYPAGYGVSLAMLWACGLACIVFAIGLKRENSKRNRGGRDERYNFPKEELENLGDDHPSFRFTF